MKYFCKGGDSMKAKKIVADAVAKVAKAMAIKSCGAASMWGAYEPKIPEAVKAMTKKNAK